MKIVGCVVVFTQSYARLGKAHGPKIIYFHYFVKIDYFTREDKSFKRHYFLAYIHSNTLFATSYEHYALDRLLCLG